MVLTKDLNLLKNRSARFGFRVHSTNPEIQLKEIFHRFQLHKHIQPFTRCTTRNGLLKEVGLEEIADKVPPEVREWCSEYKQCNKCGKFTGRDPIKAQSLILPLTSAKKSTLCEPQCLRTEVLTPTGVLLCVPL